MHFLDVFSLHPHSVCDGAERKVVLVRSLLQLVVDFVCVEIRSTGTLISVCLMAPAGSTAAAEASQTGSSTPVVHGFANCGGGFVIDPRLCWADDWDLETDTWWFLRTFVRPETEREYRRYVAEQHVVIYATMAFFVGLVSVVMTSIAAVIEESGWTLGAVFAFLAGGVAVLNGIANFMFSCLRGFLAIEPGRHRLRMAVEVCQLVSWSVHGMLVHLWVYQEGVECGETRTEILSPTSYTDYCFRQYRVIATVSQLTFAYSNRSLAASLVGQTFHVALAVLSGALTSRMESTDVINRSLIALAIALSMILLNVLRDRHGRQRFAQLVRLTSAEMSLARHHLRVAAIVRAAMPERVALRLAAENADTLELATEQGGEPLALVENGTEGEAGLWNDSPHGKDGEDEVMEEVATQNNEPFAGGVGDGRGNSGEPHQERQQQPAAVRRRSRRTWRPVPLAAWHDAAQDGTVCVSSIVDFGWLSCANLTDAIITDLHRLFSLLDEATSVFGVDQATTFGDAYIVTAGVIRGSVSGPGHCLRFALWQQRVVQESAHMRLGTSPRLRALVVNGPIFAGAVVDHRYTVAGPAVRRAMSLVTAVPGNAVWWADRNQCNPDLWLGAESEGVAIDAKDAAAKAAGCVLVRSSANAATDASSLDLLAAAQQGTHATGSSSNITPNTSGAYHQYHNNNNNTYSNTVQAALLAPSGSAPAFAADADTLARAAAALLQRPPNEIVQPPIVTGVAMNTLTATFADAAIEREYYAWATKTVNRSFALSMFVTAAVVADLLVVAVIDRENHQDKSSNKTMDVMGFVLLALATITAFGAGILFRSERKGTPAADPASEERGSVRAVEADDRRRSPRLLIAVYAFITFLVFGSFLLLPDSIAEHSLVFVFVILAPPALQILAIPFNFVQANLYSYAVFGLPVAVVYLAHNERWYWSPMFIGILLLSFFFCLSVRTVRETFAMYVNSRRSVTAISGNVMMLIALVSKLVPAHAVEAGVDLIMRDPGAAEEEDVEVWEGLSVVGRLRAMQWAGHVANVAHPYPFVTVISARLYPSQAVDPSRGTAECVEGFLRTWRTVAAAVAEAGEANLLELVQIAGDDFTVAGPLSPSDARLVRESAVAAVRLLRLLHRSVSNDARFVAVGVGDEAVGVLLGRRALRYRVLGTAAYHSDALLNAVTAGIGSGGFPRLQTNMGFFDLSVARIIEPDLGLDVLQKWVRLGVASYQGMFLPPGAFAAPPSITFQGETRVRVAHVGYRRLRGIMLDEPPPQVHFIMPAGIPFAIPTPMPMPMMTTHSDDDSGEAYETPVVTDDDDERK
jgi:hypothetical protein